MITRYIFMEGLPPFWHFELIRNFHNCLVSITKHHPEGFRITQGIKGFDAVVVDPVGIIDSDPPVFLEAFPGFLEELTRLVNQSLCNGASHPAACGFAGQDRPAPAPMVYPTLLDPPSITNPGGSLPAWYASGKALPGFLHRW